MNRDKNGRFAAKKTTKRKAAPKKMLADPMAERMDAIHRTIVKRHDTTHAALVRLTDRLKALEKQVELNTSAISVLKASDTLLQCMDRDKAGRGLEPGDYTDATKEVADALTAMGFKWKDADRCEECIILATWDDVSVIVNLPSSMFKDARHHPNAEFLRRAEVTAKKLGLTPVVPEPWRPKVGDWVVALPVRERKASLGSALDIGTSPMIAAQIDDSKEGPAIFVHTGKNGEKYHIDCRSFRPATPEEIAEATKPAPYVPQFGDVVRAKGCEWEVVSRRADADGFWLIVRYEGDDWLNTFARAEQLTLISRS